MLNIGIVGCGRVAEHHLRFVAATRNARLVALADVDLDRAKRLAVRYGVERVYASATDLLASTPLDVLHVTTPPQHHYEVAMKAIGRGVNVLVEKPTTLSAADTRRLYDEAVARGICVCPDFIHLFHPTMQKAARLIGEGGFGRVVNLECITGIDGTEPQFQEQLGLHWMHRLPGGLLHDFLPHPLYLALPWTGRPTSIEVIPRALGSLPQGLTDHLDILVQGEKALAHLVVSFAIHPQPYYLKLFCERGVVTVDFNSATLQVESEIPLPGALGRGFQSARQGYQVLKGTTDTAIDYLTGRLQPYHGLKVLIASFYAALERKDGPPVSRELALAVAEAEETVIAQAGKLHLATVPLPARQEAVRRAPGVLVTGASGYVGRALVRTLVEQGYRVRGLVRPMSHTRELEDVGIEVFYGDIRDETAVGAAMEGMEITVHLAAALNGTPTYIYETCVTGTEVVARAAAARGVRRVIYMSSVSVYDFLNVDQRALVTEGSPIEPDPGARGAASRGKATAERIALEHLGDASPTWTILRPSLIFGNGRNDLDLLGHLAGPALMVFGTANKAVPLIHVEDVAAAVLRVVEYEETAGRAFNVAHEDCVTVAEYLREHIKSGRKKPIVLYVPRWVGIAAFRVLARLLPPPFGKRLNTRRLAYLYQAAQIDSRALRDITGWSPRERIDAAIQRELGSTGGAVAAPGRR